MLHHGVLAQDDKETLEQAISHTHTISSTAWGLEDVHFYIAAVDNTNQKISIQEEISSIKPEANACNVQFQSS